MPFPRIFALSVECERSTCRSCRCQGRVRLRTNLSVMNGFASRIMRQVDLLIARHCNTLRDLLEFGRKALGGAKFYGTCRGTGVVWSRIGCIVDRCLIGVFERRLVTAAMTECITKVRTVSVSIEETDQ
jgi:hypothetical protein